jgi:hypothetical protein
MMADLHGATAICWGARRSASVATRDSELVVERTAPAIELRHDELVRAGAGDDLLPVDVVRDLDRADRQRRVGCRQDRTVPDLDRRQRVEPGGARTAQAAHQRKGHRAGEERW